MGLSVRAGLSAAHIFRQGPHWTFKARRSGKKDAAMGKFPGRHQVVDMTERLRLIPSDLPKAGTACHSGFAV